MQIRAFTTSLYFVDYFIIKTRLYSKNELSDRGFQISDSLQSQFPIYLHSQEASPCHKEVPDAYNLMLVMACNSFRSFISLKILLLTDLMSFSCKLKVGPLNNGINRAGFLAESTVDALCHIDIIPVIVDIDMIMYVQVSNGTSAN